MKEIVVIDDRFYVPKDFQTKKGVVITQHRVKEKHQGRNITFWQKLPKEKPYIPRGFIEFKIIGGKKERFKVKRLTSGQLLNFAFMKESEGE